MPELAEVELARRLWEPAIGGQILSVATHPATRVFRDTPASAIEAGLPGSRLVSSRSHGKRLLFTFQRKGSLLPLEIHLGMSGRLELLPPDHQPRKHDHLVIFLPDFALVFNDYRQFGRAHLHTVPSPWDELPPEILSPAFNENHVRTLLMKRSRTCLKALLLDQNAFPGIGNWMADEICWRLRLHPATPTSGLDARELRRETMTVTRGAIRHVADKNEVREKPGATGFKPGGYVQKVPPKSWLFQHRWKNGGICPRCQTSLLRDTIATRTTAWCPVCQPAGELL